MRNRQRVVVGDSSKSKITVSIKSTTVVTDTRPTASQRTTTLVWPEPSPWEYTRRWVKAVPTKFHSISDEVHKRANRADVAAKLRAAGVVDTRRGYYPLGPCQHVRNEQSLGTAVTLECLPLFPPTYKTRQDYANGYVEMSTKWSGGIKVDLQSDILNFPLNELYDPIGVLSFAGCQGLSLARKNALENLFPTVVGGFQLPLFIKEFTDVREVVLACAKGIRFLFAALANFPDLLKLVGSYWNGTARLSDIANHHLMVQFGMLPLIADIKNLIATMKTLSSKIENIFVNEGKLCCQHCQEVLHLDETVVDRPGVARVVVDTESRSTNFGLTKDWSSNVEGVDSRNLRGACLVPYLDHVQPDTAKYHLTVWYSYKLPKTAYAVKAALMALDSVGVSPGNVSQVWQAFPFTFIADWILDVSSILEQFDERNVELEVSVHDVCESVECRWERKLDPSDPPKLVLESYPEAWPRQLVDSLIPVFHQPRGGFLVKGRLYCRLPRVGLPVSDWQGLRMPKGLQVLNGLMLIVQRL